MYRIASQIAVPLVVRSFVVQALHGQNDNQQQNWRGNPIHLLTDVPDCLSNCRSTCRSVVCRPGAARTERQSTTELERQSDTPADRCTGLPLKLPFHLSFGRLSSRRCTDRTTINNRIGEAIRYTC